MLEEQLHLRLPEQRVAHHFRREQRERHHEVAQEMVEHWELACKLCLGLLFCVLLLILFLLAGTGNPPQFLETLAAVVVVVVGKLSGVICCERMSKTSQCKCVIKSLKLVVQLQPQELTLQVVFFDTAKLDLCHGSGVSLIFVFISMPMSMSMPMLFLSSPLHCCFSTLTLSSSLPFLNFSLFPCGNGWDSSDVIRFRIFHFRFSVFFFLVSSFSVLEERFWKGLDWIGADGGLWFIFHMARGGLEDLGDKEIVEPTVEAI